MLTRDHLRHLTLLLTLTVVFGCGPSAETTPRVGEVVKGGDDRTGEYDAVDNWWKPAPDHGDVWGWGQVSGIAVDNPDRIIVGVWGDRDALNRERDGSSNYLVAVDRDGNITENWSQWDSLFNKPHQIYICINQFAGDGSRNAIRTWTSTIDTLDRANAKTCGRNK